jgi:hypothetical protein
VPAAGAFFISQYQGIILNIAPCPIMPKFSLFQPITIFALHNYDFFTPGLFSPAALE